MKTELPGTKPLKEYLESPRYILGKLCPHGHDHTGAQQSLRHEKNRTCVTCQSIRQQKWQRSDHGKMLKQKTKQRNQSKTKETSAAYRQSKKDRIAEYNRAYIEKNKVWHLAYYRIYNSNRAKGRRKATPKWADMDAISAIYAKCQEMKKTTGTIYEVDHIVPLNSVLVCGLHVENNLQIITKSANSSKGNRWWPDGPMLCG